MRALLRTLSTHKLSASMGILYALMWAIVLLPPRADTFIVQRWLLAGVIALIWLDILTAAIAIWTSVILLILLGLSNPISTDLFLGAPNNSADQIMLLGGLLLFPTLLWVVKLEWQRGEWVNQLLLIALVIPLYLLCGAFAALFLGIPPQQITKCTLPVSDTGQFRVRVFDSHYQHLFAEYQQDGEWKQSLHITDTGKNADMCARIGTHGESLIWLWTVHTVAVSKDGGHAWYVFDDWIEHSYVTIDGVSFQDEKNGELIRFDGYPTPHTYTTTDGGRTWHLQLAHE
jgi:hypothetical protein